MSKMKTLVKRLGFVSDSEYYDYIQESYHNGQKEQARRLFRDMPKENKKAFLLDSHLHIGLLHHLVEYAIFDKE